MDARKQILAQMLLSTKKRTTHLLHFFLSILTCGLWLPVWALVCLSNSIENGRIDRKIWDLVKN